MIPDFLDDDALLNQLEHAAQLAQESSHSEFHTPHSAVSIPHSEPLPTPEPPQESSTPQGACPPWREFRTPNSKPGRPRALTSEKQAQFCDLLRLGLSRTEAARIIGVSIRTLFNDERDNPNFAESIRQALGASDTRAYRSVTRAGDKSWRAAAWLIDHRSRQERPPRKPSADAFLKSPRLKDLLRDLICEAVIANEISVDPGVVRRKKRLAELRSEIESCRRRGEEAAHLLNIAHDLTREIAKTLRLAMGSR